LASKAVEFGEKMQNKGLRRSRSFKDTMHAFDGQTDGQTEFSSLDRVCISCSAAKTTPAAQLHVRQSCPVCITTAWTFLHCWHAFNYTLSQKTRHPILVLISSRNITRFSKVIHCY